MLYQKHLLLCVALAMGVLAIAGCEDQKAIRDIEANGAAVTKPIPTVTVFVPMGGKEKQFGDANLIAIIPDLPKVRLFAGLDLDRTSVTDASIAKLAEVNQLEMVNVAHTPVTVNGVMKLKSLPKLKELRLSEDQVGPEALQKLVEAFPKATIKVATSK